PPIPKLSNSGIWREHVGRRQDRSRTPADVKIVLGRRPTPNAVATLSMLVSAGMERITLTSSATHGTPATKL
ncbi:hypothetical protein ACTUQ0_15120, partial [Listeria monocytogenes]|uniref:hypothetical protein n=1 Tax=Listeria monocytogenes TaxID=1639 RepID=UPI003FA44FFC